jgi:diguanylate cyclase
MMQYNDSVDESRRLLRLALDFIGRYDLPADPLNYCIWYEYVSGRNQRLIEAIDAFIADHGVYVANINDRLFDQYISGAHQKALSSVREDLKRLFAEIIRSIFNTSEHFRASEGHLDAINRALSPDLTKANLEKIVRQIKLEIESLESTSSSFREQLQQANVEIELLKTKLKRYQDEVFKDPLTQIANRRKFDQALKDFIDVANAEEAPLCLIMADVDHFKRINDTHGHLVGDNVLRIVAKTIEGCIKGNDLVARIGGEEFAVLLPDTPYEGAVKLAENIRRTFGKLDMKKKNTRESLGKISLSFGVTVYREPESTDHFLERADQALYRSKNEGRDRVVGRQ